MLIDDVVSELQTLGRGAAVGGTHATINVAFKMPSESEAHVHERYVKTAAEAIHTGMKRHGHEGPVLCHVHTYKGGETAIWVQPA